MWLFREPIIKSIPILKAGPDEPQYRTTHRIADNLTNDVKAIILTAVKKTKDEITLKRVEAALESGNLEEVEHLIPWETFAAELAVIIGPIRLAVEQSGNAAVKFMPKEISATLRFDLLNPRAVEWIKEHSAKLVTEVTEETKLAIRGVIQRAFEEGMHPYKSARHIRELVGLHSRQATAVDNFRRRLIRDGVSELKIDKQVEQYAKKLLRYRSEVIAREETIRSSVEGKKMLWDQAREAGLIKTEEFERSWVVTPDDRLCDICQEMEGARAPLDGFYDTPDGPMETAHLHIDCRCDEIIVPKEEGGVL